MAARLGNSKVRNSAQLARVQPCTQKLFSGLQNCVVIIDKLNSFVTYTVYGGCALQYCAITGVALVQRACRASRDTARSAKKIQILQSYWYIGQLSKLRKL